MRGRPPIYETPEQKAARKKERDIESHNERMKDPKYREQRSKASKDYRKKNPEKVEAIIEANTEQRRKRREEDPEYAESVRQAARDSYAEKARKRAAGGPDGWKVLVRMSGERRARAIVRIAHTSEGQVRGLVRTKKGEETPMTWKTLSEAQEIAEQLLAQFPNKVEVARVDVA